MIIGNGLIGTAFRNCNTDEVIIFASGVSHSKTSDQVQCERELNLLKQVLKDNGKNKCLVYFSTYSINDPNEAESLYIKHKLRIEEFLINNAHRYLIIRTGNVVGKTGNTETIFNYLEKKIRLSESFDLWVNATRNFLDIEHLVAMVNRVIEKKIVNQVVYLVNPDDMNITEVVRCFEESFHKKSVSRILPKGGVIFSDKKIAEQLFVDLGISRKDYFKRLIEKYAALEVQ